MSFDKPHLIWKNNTCAEWPSDGEKLCVRAAEYMVMKPLAPKQEDVAAFISNCGAKSFRLQALEALSANFTVHSYGRCMHNKDTIEPKPDVLQRYRFTLAFENSQVLPIIRLQCHEFFPRKT